MTKRHYAKRCLSVNTLFRADFLMFPDGITLLTVGVPAVQTFGTTLTQARGKRSLGQIVAKIHRASSALEGFTSSQLLRYEADRVERPDPVALFHLCRLYGLDLVDVVTILNQDRERLAAAKIKPTPKKIRGPSTGKASAGRLRAGSS